MAPLYHRPLGKKLYNENKLIVDLSKKNLLLICSITPFQIRTCLIGPNPVDISAKHLESQENAMVSLLMIENCLRVVENTYTQ